MDKKLELFRNQASKITKPIQCKSVLWMSEEAIHHTHLIHMTRDNLGGLQQLRHSEPALNDAQERRPPVPSRLVHAVQHGGKVGLTRHQHVTQEQAVLEDLVEV